MRASPVLVAAVLALGAPGRSDVFPKPAPERAFAALKLYDSAGRPWRVAQEDWAGARRRVAADPAWAAWLRQERAAVDRWMQKYPHDRTEWVCGWWHDFVSPKDGSHLEWTDEIPGVETEFLHSASDPRVSLTPRLLGGWVFEFRGRHAGMIERAARLWRLTGEQHYAEWAADQLDFYAAHYLDWPPQRDGARLYWQTLDVATNLFHYAEAVRVLGDEPGAARRAVWRDRFFHPQVEVLNRTRQDIHNIATWHRCAAAEVALVFGDDGLWREVLDGRFGLRRQLAEGITSDYLWWEQSLGYNAYVVRAVVGLFTTAGICGRAEELAGELAVAENLMLSPVGLRFAGDRLPNPADSTSRPQAPDRALFGATYRVFPTTLGLETVAGRRDWATLLDPPPPALAPSALPPVRGENLESTRMAQLVAGRWQVFFHYGQLTRSHAQAEALNFSATLDGVDVTHDPGTVGYGSPLHHDYYTRGLNHNVPLVGGEGEAKPPQRGVLGGYAPDRVTAAQPDYAPGVRAERTLAIEGERLVDTATLAVTDGRPRALGLALHVQGRVVLSAAFQPAPDFARGRSAAFGYWRDVRAAEFRDRAKFTVVLAGRTITVEFALPGPFRVWHGSTPDAPPDRREGFYLETTGSGATFTTTFSPVP